MNPLQYVKPAELKEALKKAVIGQDQLVDAVVNMFYLAYIRQETIYLGVDPLQVPKPQSLLIVGGTGTGKTFTLRQLAEHVEARVTVIDCATLTGQGWQGPNVTDRLLPVAQDQKERPSGLQIVMWDEADKLGYFPDRADKDATFNPTKDLLKILDGGKINLPTGQTTGDEQYIELDADGLFHVFAGAFTGVEEVIAKRLRGGGSALGFASETFVKGADALRAEITLTDIEEWGFPKELVGRMGFIASANPLGRDAMRRIVKGSEYSIEGRYREMLSHARITFSVSDEACDALADQAVAAGIGARYLEGAIAEAASPAIVQADESSAIEIKLIPTTDGKITYELGEQAGERPDGWICRDTAYHLFQRKTRKWDESRKRNLAPTRK